MAAVPLGENDSGVGSAMRRSLSISSNRKSERFRRYSQETTNSVHLSLFRHDIESRYSKYPLVRDMIIHENKRNIAFEIDGEKQMFYPLSNDSWQATIFIIEGRALDRILLPWFLVTVNAIAWTVIVENFLTKRTETDFSSYEIFFGLVLNSSLAFLLVFRLNRSAERFWHARTSWGTIVALARTMVSGIIIHGAHDPINRDNVIRWVAVFCVSTMHYIRGLSIIEPSTLAGVVSGAELKDFQTIGHMPVDAADKIRWYLGQVFMASESTVCSNTQQNAIHLYHMEKQLNDLVLHMGTLERIRSTPLPLVYVTHLRTFLLVFLFALPYIWESTLGYATIPIVFVTSFAMLGLEGAAQEVESPFQKNRTNHLNMDAFCQLVLNNIQQQIKQAADRDIALNDISNKQEKGQHEMQKADPSNFNQVDIPKI